MSNEGTSTGQSALEAGQAFYWRRISDLEHRISQLPISSWGRLELTEEVERYYLSWIQLERRAQFPHRGPTKVI